MTLLAAFKVLRRNGYLEKLWATQVDRQDHELSMRLASRWIEQKLRALTGMV